MSSGSRPTRIGGASGRRVRLSSFNTVPRAVFVTHSASGVTAMSETSEGARAGRCGIVLLVIAAAREHHAGRGQHDRRHSERDRRLAPPGSARRRNRALEHKRRRQVEDPCEIAGQEQDQRQRQPEQDRRGDAAGRRQQQQDREHLGVSRGHAADRPRQVDRKVCRSNEVEDRDDRQQDRSPRRQPRRAWRRSRELRIERKQADRPVGAERRGEQQDQVKGAARPGRRGLAAHGARTLSWRVDNSRLSSFKAPVARSAVRIPPNECAKASVDWWIPVPRRAA